MTPAKKYQRYGNFAVLALLALLAISGLFFIFKKGKLGDQDSISSPINSSNQIYELNPWPTLNPKLSYSNSWKTFVSPRGDYSLQYPPDWIKSGPAGSTDTTDVYLISKTGEGVPFVFMGKRTNEKNLDFMTWITSGDPTLKKTVKVTNKRIGNYNVKEVTGLPSGGPTTSVFFPIGNTTYVMVSIVFYGNQPNDPIIQEFAQILSTFKSLP